MGDTDFTTRFHNIEGDLISDRRRNFFKLLKESSASLNEDVINNLCPKTYLESLFHIDILIYLKRTEKLLEILQGGNDIFVSKIIKQPWFFKEALKELTAKQLVDEFLPCTSFALRMKILKKLPINLQEAHVDEIFDCVVKRYGFHIAVRILHSCTIQKIKEILMTHEVKLEPNQVQAIFDKDQELFQMYLQHYKQITKKYYYHDKVFKYVALKNPEFWLHLKNTNYVRHCKLGRRLSKKIIGLVKSDILKHTKHYSEFLREDIIVRKLHGNFKDVYFKYFPESMDILSMKNFCNVLLSYYPKKRRWYMFSETFSRAFANQSILENLIYLDGSFLDIFPNNDVRYKWAESHYKKRKDHYLWKYYDATKGIPLIKEKINVTSDIHERSNLVLLLLEICVKNDDLESLEAVLKYISFRHRNEDATFRDKLLRNICTLFDLGDLNENHWKYINEQITILRLRNEFNYYQHSIFVRKYLEYLFLNGKPFKDEIIQYITETISENDSFRVNLDNPVIERDILIQIANFSLDSIENVKDKDKNRHYSKLVTDIIDFSKDNPDVFINLLDFPNLITHVELSFVKCKDLFLIEQILLYNEQFPEKTVKIDDSAILDVILKNKKNNTISWIVGKLVKKRNRSEFENEVLKIFWDLFSSGDIRCDYIKVLTWFFENEPRTLIPYFDQILEKTLSCAFTYFDNSNIKLMSHFAFDTKMIEFYIKELNNVDYIVKKTLLGGACVTQQEDEINKFYSQRWLSSYYYLKKNVINRLSKLMGTEDFINIVAERFIPVKEKLNLDEKENMEVYKLQCEVVTSLKKLPEPVKVLPTVLKFCLGDYLQSALTSLYSIFYRSPEKMLYSYVDILLKRAVSVRKHAVFLCCELLNFDFTVNILKSLRYDNVSSQKHLFSAALKFFLKNPSEDLLTLVILNLNTIDKNDEETLNSLVHIDIPQKYKTLYIEKCWKFFEDLKEKEVAINNFLNSILDSIIYSDILVSLSRSFCENIIDSYFKERKEELYQIDLFVCKFLEYRKIEQKENFNFIFGIVTISSKNHRKRFFKTFYEIATDSLNNKKEISNNFILLFKHNWERAFTPSVMFDEHILLKLLILKYEAADPFVENYAKHVVVLLEQLVSDFGPYIYNKFQKLLNKTLNFEINRDKYLFLYNILKTETTPVNCILVLDLMKKYHGKSEEIKTIYNKILNILKNINDPVVVVHYNSYMD